MLSKTPDKILSRDSRTYKLQSFFLQTTPKLWGWHLSQWKSAGGRTWAPLKYLGRLGTKTGHNLGSILEQAVYTALREAEHRSTAPLAYWNLPFATYIVPRQVRCREAMKVINGTLDSLIAKCQRLVSISPLKFVLAQYSMSDLDTEAALLQIQNNVGSTLWLSHKFQKWFFWTS